MRRLERGGGPGAGLGSKAMGSKPPRSSSLSEIVTDEITEARSALYVLAGRVSVSERWLVESDGGCACWKSGRWGGDLPFPLLADMGEMSRRVPSSRPSRYRSPGEDSPGVMSMYESEGGVSTAVCRALCGMALGGRAGRLLSKTMGLVLLAPAAACLDCFDFLRRRAIRLS